MSLRSTMAYTVFAAAMVLGYSSNVAAQQIKVPLSGTATVKDLPTGGDAVTSDEFMLDQEADNDDGDGADHGVNRTIAKHTGNPKSSKGIGRTKSNPEVIQTAQGLNFFD